MKIYELQMISKESAIPPTRRTGALYPQLGASGPFITLVAPIQNPDDSGSRPALR